MVKPPCAAPTTPQTPMHDWMQPHEIGPAPQLFGTQLAINAPPAVMRQSCPAGQVKEAGPQYTTPHAPVLSTQMLLGVWLPVTQLATVRPAPAQSS